MRNQIRFIKAESIVDGIFSGPKESIDAMLLMLENEFDSVEVIELDDPTHPLYDIGMRLSDGIAGLSPANN